MKSKKLISKVSVLTLVGVTILGSSSSVYAKSFTKRPSCSRPSQTVKPGSNCGNTGSNSDSTTSKPGTNCGNAGSDNGSNSGNTGSDNESNSGNTGSNNGSNNGNTGSNNGSNSGNTGSDNGSNNGSTDSTVTSQTAFENRVLELVNEERAKNGLSALQMDESVREVARVKSSDMSKNNYFSHTSPTYGTPFEMLKSYGISYKSAGENIAQGYTSPEAVVNGWMNSSGHRANILNANYTHIGIGYEADGNYWTQMFIGK
ncbi:MAG: serine protease [Candidatus Cellulosilyticum pullistercoris]|uniref:Serine protease n=1 Tax=Candidatus Cellulosilyticum pullistercoris TaxID=2838521 RepID=A0A9E2NLD4_9FIRM|nr:serine protease [Candidatus Cellulosilyticum pullistercoris]